MRDNVALWTAVVALLALGAGIVYLAGRIDADALPWARLQYLFGAIEALAFAAAGWLWGKEVHREQAAAAGAAQQAAQSALAAKGRMEGMLVSMIDAVIAHAGTVASREGPTGEPAAALVVLGGMAQRIRQEL